MLASGKDLLCKQSRYNKTGTWLWECLPSVSMSSAEISLLLYRQWHLPNRLNEAWNHCCMVAACGARAVQSLCVHSITDWHKVCVLNGYGIQWRNTLLCIIYLYFYSLHTFSVLQQVEHLRWQVGDVCQCCRSDLFTPWFQGKGEWHSLCLQVISNDLSASARCCLLLASAISHSFSHLRFVNIC